MLCYIDKIVQILMFLNKTRILWQVPGLYNIFKVKISWNRHSTNLQFKKVFPPLKKPTAEWYIQGCNNKIIFSYTFVHMSEEKNNKLLVG